MNRNISLAGIRAACATTLHRARTLNSTACDTSDCLCRLVSLRSNRCNRHLRVLHIGVDSLCGIICSLIEVALNIGTYLCGNTVKLLRVLCHSRTSQLVCGSFVDACGNQRLSNSVTCIDSIFGNFLRNLTFTSTDTLGEFKLSFGEFHLGSKHCFVSFKLRYLSVNLRLELSFFALNKGINNALIQSNLTVSGNSCTIKNLGVNLCKLQSLLQRNCEAICDSLLEVSNGCERIRHGCDSIGDIREVLQCSRVRIQATTDIVIQRTVKTKLRLIGFDCSRVFCNKTIQFLNALRFLCR